MIKRAIVFLAMASTAGLSACSFGGGSGPVAAGPNSGPAGEGPLVRFDLNKDQVLTKPELEQTLQAEFKKEDVNGSGVLEPGELRTLNDRLATKPNFTPVIDWNANGQGSYTEYASQWKTLFDRSDVNRDGVVDGEELAGLARERVPRELPKPTFSGKDGKPPGAP